MVAWLAGDQSSSVTGAVIPVGGGHRGVTDVDRRPTEDLLPHREPFLFGVVRWSRSMPERAGRRHVDAHRRGGLLPGPLPRPADACRACSWSRPWPRSAPSPSSPIERYCRQAAAVRRASTRPASAARSGPATPSTLDGDHGPAPRHRRQGTGGHRRRPDRLPSRPLLRRRLTGPEAHAGSIRLDEASVSMTEADVASIDQYATDHSDGIPIGRRPAAPRVLRASTLGDDYADALGRAGRRRRRAADNGGRGRHRAVIQQGRRRLG